MEDFNMLLQEWNKIIEKNQTDIKTFLDKAEGTSAEFMENKKVKYDLGLNIFTIASSRYYLEDFHSDVLVSLLELNGAHKEGNIPLRLFIDLLNLKSKIPIEYMNYSSCEILREEGRIDILIKDTTSRRAIIIENKINDATDQPKQLIRYLNLVEDQNLIVDAIVYLTIDPFKKPDFIGWSLEDKQRVLKKLIHLPVEDTRITEFDLINKWIDPLTIEASNINFISILKQYKSLLLFLTKNKMDAITLTKFYNQLREENNLETALSVQNMLIDLPQYLADRVQNNYARNFAPFEKLWRYKNRDVVFEKFLFQDTYLKMDVWCSLEGYDIYFWVVEGENIIDAVQKKLPILKDFHTPNNETNKLMKSFPPLKEEMIFEFIDGLLIELRKMHND